MQSINLRKEKRSEEITLVHGQTFPEFGPHQYLCDEVSQVWRKRLEFLSRWTELLYDDDSDWEIAER